VEIDDIVGEEFAGLIDDSDLTSSALARVHTQD
jgi:hypothetical protein